MCKLTIQIFWDVTSWRLTNGCRSFESLKLFSLLSSRQRLALIDAEDVTRILRNVDTVNILDNLNLQQNRCVTGILPLRSGFGLPLCHTGFVEDGVA